MSFKEKWVSDCGRVTLYQGDCIEILPTLEPCDAVITDPPYASGGMYKADRCMDVSSKYVQNRQSLTWADFKGDNKDQRSWMSWCKHWIDLIQAQNGAYILSFIDWRQLPALTDVFQWVGLSWRGIAAWNKGRGARAPHKGYLRHQCEFIVWGTFGRCEIATHAGPFDGCYDFPVLQAEKMHMTGKPTKLMEAILEIPAPDSLVLDPFMGSGSTGVACVRTGRRFIGIEIDEGHFSTAKTRIQKELEKQKEMLFSAEELAQTIL